MKKKPFINVQANLDVSDIEIIEIPLEALSQPEEAFEALEFLEEGAEGEEEEEEEVSFSPIETSEESTHLDHSGEESDAIEIPDMTVTQLKKEFNEEYDGFQDTLNEYLDDIQEEKNEDLEEVKDEAGSVSLQDFLPGTEKIRPSDIIKTDDNPKTYQEGNASDFLNYLKDQYPNNIPKHNGQSVMGCEKAIGFLKSLSEEISRNVRADKEGAIDVSEAEDYNQKIIFDILKLKKHLKELKRSMTETAMKAASEIPEDSMVKSASKSAKMYICITPFHRAISGILVNSVVSAGKPFEEVYEYLVEKYQITPREELELAQVLMDMGYPLFKDRGDLKGSVDNKKTKDAAVALSGVDFITQYFN